MKTLLNYSAGKPSNIHSYTRNTRGARSEWAEARIMIYCQQSGPRTAHTGRENAAGADALQLRRPSYWPSVPAALTKCILNVRMCACTRWRHRRMIVEFMCARLRFISITPERVVCRNGLVIICARRTRDFYAAGWSGVEWNSIAVRSPLRFFESAKLWKLAFIDGIAGEGCCADCPNGNYTTTSAGQRGTTRTLDWNAICVCAMIATVE